MFWGASDFLWCRGRKKTALRKFLLFFDHPLVMEGQECLECANGYAEIRGDKFFKCNFKIGENAGVGSVEKNRSGTRRADVPRDGGLPPADFVDQ